MGKRRIEIDIKRLEYLYCNRKKSIGEIGQMLNCCSVTIWKRLKEYDLVRSGSERMKLTWEQNPKKNCNIVKLTKWSPELAYWIGFVQTDGCVYYNKERHVHTIAFQIHKRDRSLLERFKKYFEVTTTIMDGLLSQYSQLPVLIGWRFGNKIVAMFLKSIGIKTEEILKNIPTKYFWHFLTGVFDGDGTACDKGHYQFCITGQEDFIKRLAEKLGNLVVARDRKSWKVRLPLDFIRKNRNKMYRVFGLQRKKKLVFAC